MKIVIDFYSMSDFLSFIVWPLEVAEVAKVSLDNIFWQKVNFHNFWATSKERIVHVEFKFKQKKYGSLEKKIEKKWIFLFLGQKRGWPGVFDG